jgi:drug/metabolite transporter (DMT)-like permease
LISAVTIYSLATGMWLMVLKDTPLRLAYPFFGLSFVVVPILSHYLLGENLNWNVFLGAAIICIGVWVSILH